jgi:hypothetical protein
MFTEGELFKLDSILDYDIVDRLLKFNQVERVKAFPNLSKVLESYREKLKQAIEEDFESKIIESLSSDPMSQIYTRVFEFEDNYYQMMWRIDKAEEVIKKYNIPFKLAPLNQTLDFIDQDRIEKSHLSKALHNYNPIIIINYPITPPFYFVIDGNHRVVSHFQAGRQHVPAYLLEPKHHMEAMWGNACRTIFKIHSNLVAIGSYESGKMKKHLLKRYMYEI